MRTHHAPLLLLATALLATAALAAPATPAVPATPATPATPAIPAAETAPAPTKPGRPDQYATHPKAAAKRTAIATLSALGNSGVSGTVTFTDVGMGVQVVAELSGLTPGEHGIHVHEKGDCSAPDGTSAGPHFNPDNAPHGGPMAAASHHGDFGNITADKDGHAKMTFVSNRLKLSEGPDGVVGRSVVVHASPDDMKTQPSGNSGARIACGVIAMQPEPAAPASEKSGKSGKSDQTEKPGKGEKSKHDEEHQQQKHPN